MGLIDQIISGTVGDTHTNAANPMRSVEMVMKLVRNYPGGIRALLEHLRQGGLGPQVDSWLGNGPNARLTTDEVMHVVGNHRLEQLAERFGLDQTQVASTIADLLPEIVHALTPSGEVHDEIVAARMQALEAKLPRI
jgi:uncharacterized protein YidB (DUF937 family)